MADSNAVENGEGSSPPEKPRGSKMKLILGVLAVVILVGAGVVGGMLLAPKTAGGEKTPADELQEEAETGGHSAQPAHAEEEEEDSGHGSGHGGGHGDETETDGGGLYIDIKPIMTNLAGARTSRKVQAVVWLESYDEEAKKYIEQHERVIQDSIITILNSKTKEDLSSAEGNEMLKRQILMALENSVGKDKIKRVGFSSLTFY